VFDTSPCAYRMKKFVDGRLAILDVTEFLHDRVLPRLAPQPVAATVALHAVCSVRKRGLDGKLGAIARACATTVIEPPGVQCCGFAGSMGFIAPELNDHALRHLPAALPAGCRTGYATSRTCEIGLAAHAGIPYRSILYLVDEATAAGAAATPSTTAAAGTVTVAD
jgi:D-lactate dehydrogenase